MLSNGKDDMIYFLTGLLLLSQQDFELVLASTISAGAETTKAMVEVKGQHTSLMFHVVETRQQNMFPWYFQRSIVG